MQILSSLATLAFVIVGATVGIRLLVLGQRTKGLPERAVGFALLSIGGIGYPMAILAGTPDLLAPATGLRLVAISTVIVDAGFIAVVTFTWSVFRRQEAWASVLLGALSIAYVAHAIAVAKLTFVLATPQEIMNGDHLVTLGGQLLNSIAFGWTAFEAYRYWWMLRKREAIGLGDRVITNRFLLWAMAATASVLTNAISWWVVSQQIDFFASAGVQVSIGLLSVASCTCQYLAFVPPKAYLARLRVGKQSA